MSKQEYKKVELSTDTGYFKNTQITCLYCSRVSSNATGFQIGLNAEFKESICPHCGKKNIQCYYGLSNKEI